MIGRKTLFSRKKYTFFENYTMGWFLDPFREFRPKIHSLASFFKFLLQKQISIVSRNFYTITIRNLRTFLYHEVVLLSLHNSRPLSCWYNHLGKNCGYAKKKCPNVPLATKNARFWKKLFQFVFNVYLVVEMKNYDLATNFSKLRHFSWNWEKTE